MLTPAGVTGSNSVSRTSRFSPPRDSGNFVAPIGVVAKKGKTAPVSRLRNRLR